MKDRPFLPCNSRAAFQKNRPFTARILVGDKRWCENLSPPRFGSARRPLSRRSREPPVSPPAAPGAAVPGGCPQPPPGEPSAQELPSRLGVQPPTWRVKTKATGCSLQVSFPRRLTHFWKRIDFSSGIVLDFFVENGSFKGDRNGKRWFGQLLILTKDYLKISHLNTTWGEW